MVKPLLRSAKATTGPPPDRPSPHRLTPAGCCCRRRSVTPRHAPFARSGSALRSALTT
uniref:Uncharacterized protein n=1 Tax=Fagus sylvatica TaxID=28930 RepID=A0A2N9HJ08_FAGSY